MDETRELDYVALYQHYVAAYGSTLAASTCEAGKGLTGDIGGEDNEEDTLAIALGIRDGRRDRDPDDYVSFQLRLDKLLTDHPTFPALSALH